MCLDVLHYKCFEVIASPQVYVSRLSADKGNVEVGEKSKLYLGKTDLIIILQTSVI